MAEVVILTEAGGNVGYGHLMRCRAIADVAGGDLLVQGYGAYPGGDNIQEQAWMERTEELTRELPSSCSVLVDSYLATREVYAALSCHFNLVAAIDDYDRLNYPVNLVINPGLKLPPYRDQVSTVVGGSEFIILRDAIRHQAPKSNYTRMKCVLVTFGGSDDRNMLGRLVPLLRDWGLAVIAVVGDDAMRNRLAEAHPDPSVTWLGRVDASDIARLMVRSDLALSAGGQTLHELAFLGVPTVGVLTGRDQQLNIEGYVAAGFLPARLDAESLDLEAQIVELIEAYRDPALRRSAGLAGRRIVDGRGVLRIVELLQSGFRKFRREEGRQ
ncbi:MAG: hypothetical protein JW384_01679 [Nitrosomonadaceae bacterium]|nr:hypothetical protein [Nitrosomonadaceae bacterium]